MKLIYPLITIVSLFFLSCSDGTTNKKPTVTYNEDSSVNVLNPDRGFYIGNFELTQEEDYNIFEEVKEEETTLALALIYLKDYLEIETLPQMIIDNIDKNLQDAEALNIKLILRVKYRNREGEDPSKEIALSHLEQLTGVLQKHKEIISIVQAGVIGAYGEWHSFTGDYADSNEEYLENRKAIVTKLTQIFPDKYIQVRTPMHKEQMFGSAEYYKDVGIDAQITSEIAFSDDVRAKVAHHNDCFLASEDDEGTYADENINFWRDYVINDTLYSPLGGETCNDDSRFTNCSYALNELKELRWSYINQSFEEDVIQRWKDEGCYEEIRENIGYRLVATDLYLDQSDDSLDIKLNLTNKGYAAPYIKSDVSFILKDINTSNSYTYAVDDVDLRTFYSGESNAINKKISLQNLSTGTYCLSVQLRKNYSDVKLSNNDLWDDASKSNVLTCDIILK